MNLLSAVALFMSGPKASWQVDPVATWTKSSIHRRVSYTMHLLQRAKDAERDLLLLELDAQVWDHTIIDACVEKKMVVMQMVQGVAQAEEANLIDALAQGSERSALSAFERIMDAQRLADTLLSEAYSCVATESEQGVETIVTPYYECNGLG